jgi:hypothetical protein
MEGGLSKCLRKKTKAKKNKTAVDSSESMARRSAKREDGGNTDFGG